MRALLPAVLLVLAASCAAPQRNDVPPEKAESSADVIAIVGATVIHPERDGAAAVAPDNTVVIRENRIVAVGARRSTPVPAGATIIDARGKWVIPGLVDAHVHFFQSGNLYTRPDAADFNAVVPYSQETERNRARLPETFKVWLRSGVTSVADVGGPFWNLRCAMPPR